MKYKDPITGELRDVIIKSGDTLPIGTIVDFDGDVIPDGYEEATEASDVVNSLEGNEIYRAPSVKAVNEVLNGEKSMGSIIVEDVTCKNLFNKNSVLKGYELQSSDGSATTNSDWFVSDYIEIEPNKDYYLSGGRTIGTTNAFYDSEKNYLGHISALSGKITSLDNAKFVRFNGRLNELDSNIQLEKGPAATNYVEHKEFSNKQIYSTSEQVIGTWLGKPLYRKVIDFGSLPNATYKEVAHNISNFNAIVNVYGSAIRSDKTSIPLPYASSNYVELYINATKVTITTTSDRSLFNGYVTLEYTKTTD